MPAESEEAGPSYAECAFALQALINSTEWPKQRAQYALALDCVRAMQMLAEGKAGPAGRSHNEGEFYAFAKAPSRRAHFTSTPHAAILAAGDDPK